MDIIFKEYGQTILSIIAILSVISIVTICFVSNTNVISLITSFINSNANYPV